MYLTLGLEPSFLRQTFSQVRLALIGQNTLDLVIPTSIEANQPIMGTEKPPVLAVVSSRRRPRLIRTAVTPSWWSAISRSTFVQVGLSGLIVMAVVILTILAVPALYYRVFPAGTLALLPSTSGTPLGGDFNAASDSQAQITPSPTPSPTPNLPPQDMTLPAGTWLIIPRIGVRTEPKATLSEEEALADGVWLVPDFGRPGDQEDIPIIMAAHRYGWQWWWKTDYWKYHSFYNLPETEPGDFIEIIDDHRKYTYEIYAGEEGEEITDYDADLILYTCKFLNSPIRHFRYARLVDWSKNTQS